MNIHAAKTHTAPIWLTAESGDFETFRQIVSQTADPAQTPCAAEVTRNIPIYDGAMVDDAATDPVQRAALTQEWANVFANGAGIIVIRQGLADHAVIDRASAIFERVIAEEKRAAKGGGDHFAKPGANDRIWNALEKHCLADPANFAAYYSSHGIALAAEAWLGPNSQMTAQVNRVNPGGGQRRPRTATIILASCPRPRCHAIRRISTPCRLS